MFILPSIAAAQSTFKCPAGTASVEGNSQNGAPFTASGQFRYLQIHSDLPGPMVIRKLAFRRNSRHPGVGTRELEIELWMGDSVAFDRIEWRPIRFTPEESKLPIRRSASDPHANRLGHELLLRKLRPIVERI